MIAWDAPGAGASSDPPETFGMAGYADCLAGFIDALGLDRPHVAGLSFGGALALALQGRHPGVAGSLVLASAYAGWAGSLPAEVAQQRLAQAMVLADLSPEDFVGTLLPTMFSAATPQASVDEFGPAWRGSTRPASEPWPRRRPKTCATCCRTSTCRPSWSTATMTCARPWPSPSTSMPRSPARPWSSCPSRPRVQPRGPGAVQRDRPPLPPRGAHLSPRRAW